MSVAMQEAEVQTQDLQAANRATSPILGPPYDGVWLRNYTDRNVFWTSYRHRPLQGEVVAQMGTHSPNHPTSFGQLQVGLMKRFDVQEGGRYRFVFEVTAGPITAQAPAGTSMIAFTSAGGFDSEVLPPSRQPYTRHLTVARDLGANTTVRLYCSARVTALVRPGTNAYGEVIAAVPRISAFQTPLSRDRAESAESREDDLRDLLEQHGDLDAAIRALSESEPGQEIVDRELDLTEAFRIGERTVTSLNGADA